MTESEPSGGPMSGPEKKGRGMGGSMWAMWICCLGILLFLLLSFLRR